MRAHKQRLGSLAEFRLPACRHWPRWTPSRSSLPIGRWSLGFPFPELLHASFEPRPSHPIAAPGMRFPSPSSIGYCCPSVEPRLDTLPVTERLGPTAALPQRPPALCLANSYCYSSTAEVEQLQVGKWKRRAFEPGVNLDKEQLARPENPTPAARV